MPAELRLGQQLFFSATSKKYPMTQNFWVSCASCHLEGRSDAVIWRFLQGPRDTPSNGGGTLYRGFLQRNAVRNSVMQYNEIVKTEQGGLLNVYLDPTQPGLCAELPQNSDAASQQNCQWLAALAAYVNYAIPLPVSPEDPQGAAAIRGQQVFAQVGCTTCHVGTALTDSGTGNSDLDLAGQVLLHDVGTCVKTGAFVDQPIDAFEDRAGQTGVQRPACQFNTPSLHGLFDSAPYIHDGRYQTIEEAMDYFLTRSAVIPTPAQRADLLSYLRSL
jgi:cytochrome c peroxidase